MLLDAVILLVAGALALLVRYDFNYNNIGLHRHFEIWLRWLPVEVILTVGIFWLRRMYHYMWSAVSAYDVLEIGVSVALAYAACLVVFEVQSLFTHAVLPRSYWLLSFVFELVLFTGARCAYRLFWVLIRSMRRSTRDSGERIMLIGAGSGGTMLARELLSSGQIDSRPCCFIDDNPHKWGKTLEGIPVVGGREDIPRVVKEMRITQIIFAIPTADAATKRDILAFCRDTGCKIKVVPGVYQLLNGEIRIADTQDVKLEDLLGREPVHLDTEVLGDFLRDQIVLVTGGGGSIGSELCRQIAKYQPRQLIVLDIYENNAYDLQQELIRTYGKSLDLAVEIASVRDKEKTQELFEKYRPDIVFHAAAHKHVPLMEACPDEAIKNNIFGTYHVVRAAEKTGVKKFVMISTDKAVNPTNFMGATKRFCEMILQSREESRTVFCSVRFGNVLGSNGSVVPLFKRQIEEGGPVTITDKRIIRYFMTIPEAAQLVLEAGAIARSRQIFVLDMGEPVKILDLAENLIRLSGLKPYEDIEIREIGLRPGEKLYEELLIKGEQIVATENRKIFVEQQREIDPDMVMRDLESLDLAVTAQLPPYELIRLLQSMIPTYHDPKEVNAASEAAQESGSEKTPEDVLVG